MRIKNLEIADIKESFKQRNSSSTKQAENVAKMQQYEQQIKECKSLLEQNFIKHSNL